MGQLPAMHEQIMVPNLAAMTSPNRQSPIVQSSDGHWCVTAAQHLRALTGSAATCSRRPEIAMESNQQYLTSNTAVTVRGPQDAAPATRVESITADE